MHECMHLSKKCTVSKISFATQLRVPVVEHESSIMSFENINVKDVFVYET